MEAEQEENGIFRAMGRAIFNQMREAEENGLAWDRYGRIAAYCCSLYAVVCFMAALTLNRIFIIAAARPRRHSVQHLHLLDGFPNHWSSKMRASLFIVLRLGAIVMLVVNLFKVLVALNVNAKISTPEGQNWWFQRYLWDGLFLYDPERYADVTALATPRSKVMVGPSSELYWPVFLGLCCLQLVETFVSVAANVKPYSESLVTLFELSVVFHLDDSGYGVFGGRRPIAPTERLLMIAFFLTLGALNIHIGALVNQNRTRLIPLSMISLSFLAYLVARVPLFNILWLFFSPQVVIASVLCISVAVFVLAIISTGFQWRTLNYSEFLFPEDPENEASRGLATLRLDDDFTVGLVKLGKLALILAGKLSYVSEIGWNPAHEQTWIEKSLWSKVGDQIEILKKRTSPEVIDILSRTGTSGYGTIIETPSVSWMYDEAVVVNQENSDGSKNKTLLRRRYSDMKLVVGHLSQLLYGLVVDKLLQPLYRKVLQHEYNEPKVPKFLEQAINRKIEPAQVPEEMIEPDTLSAEDLLGHITEPWAENDATGDYVDLDSDTDVESDIESMVESFVGEIVDTELLNDLSQPDFAHIFRQTMQNDQIMTRSRFRLQKQQMDDGSKLIELFMERRKDREATHQVDSEGDLEVKNPCVVCQINPREYISWPCRCFSVCGSCRSSLATKGMNGCVCCRRHVEGVTKVYIP